MEETKIRELHYGAEGYPKRLLTIPDPPKKLYVIGELPEEERPTAAVIGARECSEYGRFVAMKLGETLGKCGIQVISGMARGIDGIAQKAALDAGGRSVAVLGSGVDVCYPLSNQDLYERLKTQGGIVSEYPLGTKAMGRLFPARNRIVSGLADVLVVVEAREKSGTLITVDMALEQGKEVYVVPGRITDRLSDGCNKLIPMGAGVLLNPSSFVKEMWGLENRRTEEQSQADRLPEELQAVYKALETQAMNAGQLNEKLGNPYDEKELNLLLMRLCLEGAASQVSPGNFTRR